MVEESCTRRSRNTGRADMRQYSADKRADNIIVDDDRWVPLDPNVIGSRPA